MRLFKWVRIYAGGDKYRACRVENTNRPAEQIQVSAGNKSTSFWLLDIFAPNWRGQFKLSTLYRRKFEFFFCQLPVSILNLNRHICLFVCVCKYTCGFPDISVIWIYGHMAWLLSVRPLFLCPAIKGGKLPKHFAFSAFTPKLCRSCH